MKIAIVGAGVAGLTCARALVKAGLAPVIFDKSRGVGGRLATRRAEQGLQFDHGAPYLTATGPGFAEALRQAEAAGALARWPGPLRATDAGAAGYVGLPGMSGFARYLAGGLEIRAGIAVTGVTPVGQGWRVAWAEEVQDFDRVILTLPAPQILRLIGTDQPLAVALGAVAMAPCLTLMAAFDGPGASPPPERTETEDLDWIALDTSKPGRDGGRQCWVAQANAAFSHRHLELDPPQIADLMLPLLCRHIGRPPSEATHAVAHRWRFSQAERPLGQPFLADASEGLLAGGDWCLGRTAEDAWTSGRALAAQLLGG